MEMESVDSAMGNDADRLSDEEEFGWEFHKWPLGIAIVITLLLYGMIWLFVEPNPVPIDPTQLPPPPGSF